ncbi:MAG: cysteine desulfurase family protein [Leadbetterella sp.]
MELPVYFDNAATTPLHPDVWSAMEPYFIEHFGNPSSRHHAYGWLAEDAVSKATSQISSILKIPTQYVTYTSGATESINTALKGSFELDPSITFIAPSIEHKATLDTLDYIRSKGGQVMYWPWDSEKGLNIDFLKNGVETCKNVLLSVSLVNNETGYMAPMDEIFELKKTKNFLLHVDASQAVGKLNLSHFTSNVDFMSFSGHKICGPKGIGVLFSCQRLPKWMSGGDQQSNKRGGTLAVSSIVGLATALSLASEARVAFNQNTQTLKSYLESNLEELFDVALVSKNLPRVSNISMIRFKGKDSERMLQRLASRFALSNGSACNSASVLPSHVLTAMGLNETEAFEGIRFSFGVQNTMDEVKDLVHYIKEIYEDL